MVVVVVLLLALSPLVLVFPCDVLLAGSVLVFLVCPHQTAEVAAEVVLLYLSAFLLVLLLLVVFLRLWLVVLVVFVVLLVLLASGLLVSPSSYPPSLLPWIV